MVKKKASPSTLLISAIALGILALVPTESWAFTFAIAILGLVVWKIAKGVAEGRETKASSGSPTQRAVTSPSSARGTGFTVRLERTETMVEKESFTSLVQVEGPKTKEHRIPTSPMAAGDKWWWVQTGSGITVAGFDITSGMLYVGSGLRTPYGEADPALVNPHLKVSVEPVILQPGFLVADDLTAGTLVELMPDYRSIELGIYPTRKFVPPKVRALIDFLAEHLATPPVGW